MEKVIETTGEIVDDGEVTAKDVATHMYEEARDHIKSIHARDGLFAAVGAGIGAVAYWAVDEFL